MRVWIIAAGLFAVLAGRLLAQEKVQVKATRSPPVSDTFPEILEKALEASGDGFKSIRGAPIVGEDSGTVHYFRWRATIILPRAKNCLIEQLEVTYADGHVNAGSPLFVCDMGTLDQGEFLPSIKAALGPGWLSGSCDPIRGPPTKSGPICFYEAKYTNVSRVYIGADSNKGKTIVICVFPLLMSDHGSTASSPQSEMDGIADVIARIERAQHASLPSIQAGPGSGPITIQNDTSSTLTVYFSGSINRKEAVPPHSQTVVSLESGAYKVAGELSDKSVLPFFGRRNYLGGETERFYIAPR